jgi:hypothetical protein
VSAQRFRIRRCNGNRQAWLPCRLDRDGTEYTNHGSITTAMSLDALLARAGHLAPRAGDHVEMIVS